MNSQLHLAVVAFKPGQIVTSRQEEPQFLHVDGLLHPIVGAPFHGLPRCALFLRSRDKHNLGGGIDGQQFSQRCEPFARAFGESRERQIQQHDGRSGGTKCREGCKPVIGRGDVVVGFQAPADLRQHGVIVLDE